jgi:hypothetical protein
MHAELREELVLEAPQALHRAGRGRRAPVSWSQPVAAVHVHKAGGLRVGLGPALRRVQDDGVVRGGCGWGLDGRAVAAGAGGAQQLLVDPAENTTRSRQYLFHAPSWAFWTGLPSPARQRGQ